MKTLKFNIFISQFIGHKRYTMNSFFYVVSIAFHTSVPALRKCMDTSKKKSFGWTVASRAPPATSLRRTWKTSWTLVHSYTCCSDRHASPYWTFIRRWISMDFTPSLLKNGWQNAVLLWCMLQAGLPSLHYYCAVLLHSCIVLPPVGHSSNHQYHCCQLTRQSSCVSNFYRTFNIFIWLSLVFMWTQDTE
jgi:hypothetical protein